MKKLITFLLVLCVIFVAGFAGYRGYKIWKPKRLVKQAWEYIAKGDLTNSVLCLRQALQKNPNNLEACRLMADYTEAARSPQAVFWRSRILELEPNSLTNRLALARTAIAAGDLTSATRALDGVDAEGQKTAAFSKALPEPTRWPRPKPVPPFKAYPQTRSCAAMLCASSHSMLCGIQTCPEPSPCPRKCSGKPTPLSATECFTWTS
jgi:hypothetical protein